MKYSRNTIRRSLSDIVALYNIFFYGKMSYTFVATFAGILILVGRVQYMPLPCLCIRICYVSIFGSIWIMLQVVLVLIVLSLSWSASIPFTHCSGLTFWRFYIRWTSFLMMTVNSYGIKSYSFSFVKWLHWLFTKSCFSCTYNRTGISLQNRIKTTHSKNHPINHTQRHNEGV